MTDAHSRWTQILLQAMFLALLVVVLPSCSDDPTEQNALLFPGNGLPTVGTRDTTIFAVSDTTLLARIAMNGPQNLVGAASGLSSAYSASALIRFTPGLFPARDTASVFSATLNLHFVYHRGAPGGQLAFNIYRISTEWDESTFTWDSLQANSQFYDATRARTLNGQPFVITLTNPDSQTVRIPLDTVMGREWYQTLTSTDVTKFGIILVPTNSCNVVGGFSSFSADSISYYPAVTIIAGNASGTLLDTATYSNGFDTLAGNVQIPLSPATMTIQAGMAFRGLVRFDLSFLARGTVINSAEVMVDRRTDPTLLTTPSDSLEVHFTADAAGDLLSSTSSILTPKSGSTSTLAGNITSFAQLWLVSPNYGLVVRIPTPGEMCTFDLMRLYGSQATQTALRPRLHITYTDVHLGKKP